MKIGIVIEDLDTSEYDYLIGVEKGATYKLVDLAIGDFDSTSINNVLAKKTLKFPPEKDYTDTYLAVKEALKLSNDITILGGIKGKRIEHLIANLNILVEFPFIKMKDENSLIFIVEDEYKFDYDDSFYSFYAINDTYITLKGFKYEISNYLLKPFDSLCISNELISDGYIKTTNKLLVIKTKKDA